MCVTTETYQRTCVGSSVNKTVPSHSQHLHGSGAAALNDRTGRRSSTQHAATAQRSRSMTSPSLSLVFFFYFSSLSCGMVVPPCSQHQFLQDVRVTAQTYQRTHIGSRVHKNVSTFLHHLHSLCLSLSLSLVRSLVLSVCRLFSLFSVLPLFLFFCIDVLERAPKEATSESRNTHSEAQLLNVLRQGKTTRANGRRPSVFNCKKPKHDCAGLSRKTHTIGFDNDDTNRTIQHSDQSDHL